MFSPGLLSCLIYINLEYKLDSDNITGATNISFICITQLQLQKDKNKVETSQVGFDMKQLSKASI